MFYGIAITSVTALFTLASAYGEANLKAPNKIDGRYRLAPTEAPSCLPTEALLLVQQSGVYLTGSLLRLDAAESEIQKALERPSLTGQWQNGQWDLQGALRPLPHCEGTIRLRGTVEGVVERGTVKEAHLNGTISLSVLPSETRFTAQMLAVQPVAQPQGH